MPRKSPLGLRTAALLLAAVFSWDTVVWPAPPLPAPPAFRLPQKIEIEIPDSLGSIQERYLPETARTQGAVPFIIHIQDAHSHPEAQKNIQAILGLLAREKKIGKIAVEGAFGKIDPGIFNFFPVPEVNEAMAERLAEMGELTGAELFALKEKGRPVEIHGVEAIGLYRESFRLFQKIKSRHKAVDERLRSLERGLEQIGEKRLNGELKSWLQKKRDWEEKRDSSLAYFRTLNGLSKKHLNLDFTDPKNQFDWPNLTRLLKVDEIESRLRRERARLESEKLARELKEKLAAGEKRDFLLEGFEGLPAGSQAGPSGSWRRFFEILYEETKKQEMSLLNYPDFLRWGGILILREEINASFLLQELAAIEEKLAPKLARNRDERKILRRSKDLYLLRRLLELRMTREEFEEYQKRRTESLRAPKGVKQSQGLLRSLRSLATAVQWAEQFYLLSRRRDRVLLENMLKISRPGKATVLITGGFHSAGLGELLKEKQIPYLVITPKMTRLEDENLYEKVMRGENANLDEWLAKVSTLVKALITNFVSDPKTYEAAGMNRSEARNLILKAALLAARSELGKKGWSRERILGSLQQMVQRKPVLFGSVGFIDQNGEIRIRLAPVLSDSRWAEVRAEKQVEGGRPRAEVREESKNTFPASAFDRRPSTSLSRRAEVRGATEVIRKWTGKNQKQAQAYLKEIETYLTSMTYHYEDGRAPWHFPLARGTLDSLLTLLDEVIASEQDTDLQKRILREVLSNPAVVGYLTMIYRQTDDPIKREATLRERIKWLTTDDEVIRILREDPEFQPLARSAAQNHILYVFLVLHFLAAKKEVDPLQDPEGFKRRLKERIRPATLKRVREKDLQPLAQEVLAKYPRKKSGSLWSSFFDFFFKPQTVQDKATYSHFPYFEAILNWGLEGFEVAFDFLPFDFSKRLAGMYTDQEFKRYDLFARLMDRRSTFHSLLGGPFRFELKEPQVFEGPEDNPHLIYPQIQGASQIRGEDNTLVMHLVSTSERALRQYADYVKYANTQKGSYFNFLGIKIRHPLLMALLWPFQALQELLNRLLSVFKIRIPLIKREGGVRIVFENYLWKGTGDNFFTWDEFMEGVERIADQLAKDGAWDALQNNLSILVDTAHFNLVPGVDPLVSMVLIKRRVVRLAKKYGIPPDRLLRLIGEFHVNQNAGKGVKGYVKGHYFSPDIHDGAGIEGPIANRVIPAYWFAQFGSPEAALNARASRLTFEQIPLPFEDNGREVKILNEIQTFLGRIQAQSQEEVKRDRDTAQAIYQGLKKELLSDGNPDRSAYEFLLTRHDLGVQGAIDEAYAFLAYFESVLSEKHTEEGRKLDARQALAAHLKRRVLQNVLDYHLLRDPRVLIQGVRLVKASELDLEPISEIVLPEDLKEIPDAVHDSVRKAQELRAQRYVVLYPNGVSVEEENAAAILVEGSAYFKDGDPQAWKDPVQGPFSPGAFLGNIAAANVLEVREKEGKDAARGIQRRGNVFVGPEDQFLLLSLDPYYKALLGISVFRRMTDFVSDQRLLTNDKAAEKILKEAFQSMTLPSRAEVRVEKSGKLKAGRRKGGSKSEESASASSRFKPLVSPPRAEVRALELGQELQKIAWPKNPNAAKGIEDKQVSVSGNNVVHTPGDSTLEKHVISDVTAAMNAAPGPYSQSVTLDQSKKTGGLGFRSEDAKLRPGQDVNQFIKGVRGENRSDVAVEERLIDSARRSPVKEGGDENIRVNDDPYGAQIFPGVPFRKAVESRGPTGGGGALRNAGASSAPQAPSAPAGSRGRASRPNAVSPKDQVARPAVPQAVPPASAGILQLPFAFRSPLIQKDTLVSSRRQATRAEVRSTTAQKDLEFARAFRQLDLSDPKNIVALRILKAIVLSAVFRDAVKNIPAMRLARESQTPKEFLDKISILKKDRDLFGAFVDAVDYQDEESNPILLNPSFVSALRGLAFEALPLPIFGWEKGRLVLNPKHNKKIVETLKKAAVRIRDSDAGVRASAEADLGYVANMGFSGLVMQDLNSIQTTHREILREIDSNIQSMLQVVKEVHEQAGRPPLPEAWTDEKWRAFRKSWQELHDLTQLIKMNQDILAPPRQWPWPLGLFQSWNRIIGTFYSLFLSLRLFWPGGHIQIPERKKPTHSIYEATRRVKLNAFKNSLAKRAPSVRLYEAMSVPATKRRLARVSKAILVSPLIGVIQNILDLYESKELFSYYKILQLRARSEVRAGEKVEVEEIRRLIEGVGKIQRDPYSSEPTRAQAGRLRRQLQLAAFPAHHPRAPGLDTKPQNLALHLDTLIKQAQNLLGRAEVREKIIYEVWPELGQGETKVTFSGFYGQNSLVFNSVRLEEENPDALRFLSQMVPFYVREARKVYPSNPYPLEFQNIVNPHSLAFAKRSFVPGTIEISPNKEEDWKNIQDPSFDLYAQFGPLVIQDEGPYWEKEIVVAKRGNGYTIVRQPKGLNVKIRDGYRVIVRDGLTGKLLRHVEFAKSFKLRGVLLPDREGVGRAEMRTNQKVPVTFSREQAARLEKGWVIANHILVAFHAAFISSVLSLPRGLHDKTEVLAFLFLSPETLISLIFWYLTFHIAVWWHERGHYWQAVRQIVLRKDKLSEAQEALKAGGLKRFALEVKMFLLAPFGKFPGIQRVGLGYQVEAPFNLTVAAAGPQASRGLALVMLPLAGIFLSLGLYAGFEIALYIGRLALGIGAVGLLDRFLADPGKLRQFREQEARARQAKEQVARVPQGRWIDQMPSVYQKMKGSWLQEVGRLRASWPFRNSAGGGRHTEEEYPESNISLQEGMLIPLSAKNYEEAQEMTVRLQDRLKQIIDSTEGSRVMGKALEGNLAPYITPEAGDSVPELRMWRMMKQAIKEVGLIPGKDVVIAIDPAASELETAYREEFDQPDAVGQYLFWRDRQKHVMNREELLGLYRKALEEGIPIISIEDGFSENDEEGWKLLMREFGDKMFVIGDDLVTTKDETIEKAADSGMINAVLIKANQIGTLTETVLAMLTALGKGLDLVVSHRSKKPNDTMEADISLASGAAGLKSGGGANTERLVVYQTVAKALAKARKQESKSEMSENGSVREFEDALLRKLAILDITAIEEPTNAGIPTVGVEIKVGIPGGKQTWMFTGATPLGTSAGTGEAVHLIDSMIYPGTLTAKYPEFFSKDESGTYQFKRSVTLEEIRSKDNPALLALWKKARRYEGKGVLNAVENAERVVAGDFLDNKASELGTLMEIDRRLLADEVQIASRRGQDVSDPIKIAQRKANLGMNAILSVSLALARFKAWTEGKELSDLLREQMTETMAKVVAEHDRKDWKKLNEDLTFDELVTELQRVAADYKARGKPLYQLIRRHLPVYDLESESGLYKRPSRRSELRVFEPQFNSYLVEIVRAIKKDVVKKFREQEPLNPSDLSLKIEEGPTGYQRSWAKTVRVFHSKTGKPLGAYRVKTVHDQTKEGREDYSRDLTAELKLATWASQKGLGPKVILTQETEGPFLGYAKVRQRGGIIVEEFYEERNIRNLRQLSLEEQCLLGQRFAEKTYLIFGPEEKSFFPRTVDWFVIGKGKEIDLRFVDWGEVYFISKEISKEQREHYLINVYLHNLFYDIYAFLKSPAMWAHFEIRLKALARQRSEEEFDFFNDALEKFRKYAAERARTPEISKRIQNFFNGADQSLSAARAEVRGETQEFFPLSEIEKQLTLPAGSLTPQYPDEKYDAFLDRTPGDIRSRRVSGTLKIRSKENPADVKEFVVKTPNPVTQYAAGSKVTESEVALYASSAQLGPFVFYADPRLLIEEKLPLGYELSSRGLLLSPLESASFGKALAEAFHQMVIGGQALYFGNVPQTHIFVLGSLKNGNIGLRFVDWSNSYIGNTEVESVRNQLRTLIQFVYLTRTFLGRPKNNILAWKNFEIRLLELQEESGRKDLRYSNLLTVLREHLFSYEEFFRQVDKMDIVGTVKITPLVEARQPGDLTSIELEFQGERSVRLVLQHDPLIGDEMAQAIAVDLFKRGYLQVPTLMKENILPILKLFLEANGFDSNKTTQVISLLEETLMQKEKIDPSSLRSLLPPVLAYSAFLSPHELTEAFIRYLKSQEARRIKIRTRILPGMANRERGDILDIFLEENPNPIKSYVIKEPHRATEPQRSKTASDLNLGPRVIYTRDDLREKQSDGTWKLVQRAVIVEDLLPSGTNIREIDAQSSLQDPHAQDLLVESLSLKIYRMIDPKRGKETVLHKFDGALKHMYFVDNDFLMIDWAFDHNLRRYEGDNPAQNLADIFEVTEPEFRKFGRDFWDKFKKSILEIATIQGEAELKEILKTAFEKQENSPFYKLFYSNPSAETGDASPKLRNIAGPKTATKKPKGKRRAEVRAIESTEGLTELEKKAFERFLEEWRGVTSGLRRKELDRFLTAAFGKRMSPAAREQLLHSFETGRYRLDFDIRDPFGIKIRNAKTLKPIRRFFKGFESFHQFYPLYGRAADLTNRFFRVRRYLEVTQTLNSDFHFGRLFARLYRKALEGSDPDEEGSDPDEHAVTYGPGGVANAYQKWQTEKKRTGEAADEIDRAYLHRLEGEYRQAERNFQKALERLVDRREFLFLEWRAFRMGQTLKTFSKSPYFSDWQPWFHSMNRSKRLILKTLPEAFRAEVRREGELEITASQREGENVFLYPVSLREESTLHRVLSKILTREGIEVREPFRRTDYFLQIEIDRKKIDVSSAPDLMLLNPPREILVKVSFVPLVRIKALSNQRTLLRAELQSLQAKLETLKKYHEIQTVRKKLENVSVQLARLESEIAQFAASKPRAEVRAQPNLNRDPRIKTLAERFYSGGITREELEEFRKDYFGNEVKSSHTPRYGEIKGILSEAGLLATNRVDKDRNRKRFERSIQLQDLTKALQEKLILLAALGIPPENNSTLDVYWKAEKIASVSPLKLSEWKEILEVAGLIQAKDPHFGEREYQLSLEGLQGKWVVQVSPRAEVPAGEEIVAASLKEKFLTTIAQFFQDYLKREGALGREVLEKAVQGMREIRQGMRKAGEIAIQGDEMESRMEEALYLYLLIGQAVYEGREEKSPEDRFLEILAAVEKDPRVKERFSHHPDLWSQLIEFHWKRRFSDPAQREAARRFYQSHLRLMPQAYDSKNPLDVSSYAAALESVEDQMFPESREKPLSRAEVRGLDSKQKRDLREGLEEGLGDLFGQFLNESFHNFRQGDEIRIDLEDEKSRKGKLGIHTEAGPGAPLVVRTKKSYPQIPNLMEVSGIASITVQFDHEAPVDRIEMERIRDLLYNVIVDHSFGRGGTRLLPKLQNELSGYSLPSLSAKPPYRYAFTLKEHPDRAEVRTIKKAEGGRPRAEVREKNKKKFPTSAFDHRPSTSAVLPAVPRAEVRARRQAEGRRRRAEVRTESKSTFPASALGLPPSASTASAVARRAEVRTKSRSEVRMTQDELDKVRQKAVELVKSLPGDLGGEALKDLREEVSQGRFFTGRTQKDLRGQILAASNQIKAVLGKEPVAAAGTVVRKLGSLHIELVAADHNRAMREILSTDPFSLSGLSDIQVHVKFKPGSIIDVIQFSYQSNFVPTALEFPLISPVSLSKALEEISKQDPRITNVKISGPKVSFVLRSAEPPNRELIWNQLSDYEKAFRAELREAPVRLPLQGLEKFEVPIAVVELASFQVGFDVVPGLVPFIPYIKLNFFEIGSDGASLGENLTPAQRVQLRDYKKQISDFRLKAPVSPSGTPRTVVLVSDGRNVPQVDLQAMELPMGSRIVAMAPGRSRLKAYERYAKVKIPGVSVRSAESAGELPSLEQLQKIFSERRDSIPILIFRSGFHELESYKRASDQEGFVVSMPWTQAAQTAFSDLVGHSLPRNLLGKVPRELVTFRVSYSDALSPVSVPAASERNFADYYLSRFTRQREFQTAA